MNAPKLRRQAAIGVIAVVGGLLLIFAAIPAWVSSPSNVRDFILSPVMWPYVLAGLTVLVGLGMILTGAVSSEGAEPGPAAPPGGWLRLAIMATIMAIYLIGLPRIGMVWTSMAAFAATAFLMRTSHPVAAVASAVLVPLALYAFFAHVALVAVPQGDFVRLP